MKWFDYSEDIRGHEMLSPEQTAYLTRPSLTLFGPLNILVRKHWDLLLGIIATSSIGNGIESVLADVDGVSYLERLVNAEPFIVVALLVNLCILLLLLSFGILHGRRLAWNRNARTDFDAFTRSERRWTPWAYAMLVLGLVALLLSFL